MKMTAWAKHSLAFRRQEKKLTQLGYQRHETDWEVIRGIESRNLVILDAVISTDGKYVYTKIGKPPHED